MRYLALVSDYDGTLAKDGKVDEETLAALERLVASGRKLLLVTGRRLDELLSVFPDVGLCELVVAENGGVLYDPHTEERRALGDPPQPAFVKRLRERGVDPLGVGEVIVGTWRPHEGVVLEAIRDLGLELQVSFNKGAVMVLPAGVNKASGLLAALKELELSPHNAAGVGDAENDHAFLALCECAVAVENALPALKERCDHVTHADHGAGVAELIDRLLDDDLASLDSSLTRHHILLGSGEEGEQAISPYGTNLLLAGASGSGKSTLATGLVERLMQRGYQVCIVDPEGDYSSFGDLFTLGDADQPPALEEVLKLLSDPTESVAVNLLGLPLEDRPRFFEGLLPDLQQLRARTGRPHWLVLDEAHHLLPSSWRPVGISLPKEMTALMLITVHPDRLAPAVQSAVNTVVLIGESPGEILSGLDASGPVPKRVPEHLRAGEALLWLPSPEGSEARDPVRFTVASPKAERRRHVRKYAEGELPPDRSFFFRGPEGKLKLRAQNLVRFLQLAGGVDDETWLHHLRQGDYARWIREGIKDEGLAEEVAEVSDADLSADESRQRIREAVEKRYTKPA